MYRCSSSFYCSTYPHFLFYQFLKGISTAFLDAARVDGCTEIGIFVKIILPLMAPAFASMGIYQGMIGWNNFLWPLIVLKSNSKMTLPIGLSTLMTPYGNNYDILLAGSVMAIIPVLILFLAFQKYFIAGMTAGGVKG
ncbi:carbohydrate ABC transporter permease [Blautia sp. RD014234]|nr:carbohydrate ABC transporter permease [Blautia parvula]